MACEKGDWWFCQTRFLSDCPLNVPDKGYSITSMGVCNGWGLMSSLLLYCSVGRDNLAGFLWLGQIVGAVGGQLRTWDGTECNFLLVSLYDIRLGH
jgi:hypothetical protein